MGEAARKRRRVGQETNIDTLDPITGAKLGKARYGGSLRALIHEKMMRLERGQDDANVPCGSCTACCYHSLVDVDPAKEPPANLAHLDIVEDSASKYNYRLRKRDDGACIHLGLEGCTVYKYRPHACRAYDCRLYSAIGVADHYDNGRQQPPWIFDSDTQEERVFYFALLMGVAPLFKDNNWSANDALKAAFTALPDNLPKAQKIVAEFEAMPHERQRAIAQAANDYLAIKREGR